MTPPPIQLFLTTIASQITLRQRQEYVLRILQVKKIPFTSYDLASDEDAKKLWRRKAPRDKQQLPGILVGGEFPGTFEQFEEAVEFNELSTFFRLNEDYQPFVDDAPLLRAEPVGVPGAYSPLQMHPQHAVHSRSPSPSPLALREKEKKEVQAGEALAEFGLGDVSVSMDELKALVEELGLGGEEANELVSGLAGTEERKARKEKKEEKKEGKKEEKKVAVTAPLGKGKVEGKAADEKVIAKQQVKDEGGSSVKEEVKNLKDKKTADEAPQINEEPRAASEPTSKPTEDTNEPQTKEAPESPQIKILPPLKTLPVEPKATS